MKANYRTPVHIQERSPYERLDPATEKWIDLVKSQWASWKKSTAVSQLLNDLFSNSKNPYESALKAMANSGDFYFSKTETSLSYYVMDCFMVWKNLFSSKLPPLTSKLKIDAFNLVTKQRSHGLTKLVIEVFEMKDDKLIFLDTIRALAQRNMYKEACQGAIMLELYDCFNVEEFIIPLIFQDKFTIAQDFLNLSQRLQSETARYLDNILGQKNVRAEVERINRALRIFDMKIDKMSSKSLSKLLKRIITLYKIPPETCPNLTKKKGFGALQFLLRKRFVENTIGVESWSEMVEETVGDNRELQLELVFAVSLYGEEAEAIRWADKYNIPNEQRPYKIQYDRKRMILSGGKNQTSLQKWVSTTDASSNHTRFHKLKLSESEIHLIDTLTDFQHFLETCLNDVFVCGMDCEWKPSMGLRRSELALIQIATFDAVFIIDVSTLLPLVSGCLWQHFATKVFLNTELLKIGFGFKGDFTVIQDTLPHFKTINPTGPGYLDLLTLWRLLVHNHNFEFPFVGEGTSSGSSESLNRLVELCLGEKLNKSDQFSNWEKRPLRKSQITYAALDAYCLLEVYDVLQSKAESQNIPFSEVLALAIQGEKVVHKKTRKNSRNRTP